MNLPTRNPQPDTPSLRETASAYAKASADTSARQADTQTKPLYQLAHLIAMLQRQQEAREASQPRNSTVVSYDPPNGRRTDGST
jgi:hypothetical protein